MMSLQLVVQSVNPTLVVLPSKYKSDPELLKTVGVDIQTCSKDANGSSSHEKSLEDYQTDSENRSPNPEKKSQEAKLHVPCKYLPISEYTLTNATLNMGMISVLGMPSGLGVSQKHVYMKHLFDTDCELGFRCLGGLVGFVLKHGCVRSAGRVGDPTAFNTIGYRNFLRCLRLPRSTMSALNIYHQESHPLGHGSGNAKEGLSLFGILNRTPSRFNSGEADISSQLNHRLS